MVRGFKKGGYTHSKKVRKKISEKNKGVSRNANELNPMWKGNKVRGGGLHRWVRRHKPKPRFCEICKKRKPYDIANISQKYKRNINDYRWLCRSCHMKSDGRMKNLRNQDGKKYFGKNSSNWKGGISDTYENRLRRQKRYL